jgi:hypothetical protein
MTLAGVGYHFLTPVTMVTTKSQASMAYVALHNPTVSYDTGDSVSCNHPFFSILKITCVTTRYPRIEPDTLQGYKSQGLALLIEQNLKGLWLRLPHCNPRQRPLPRRGQIAAEAPWPSPPVVEL